MRFTTCFAILLCLAISQSIHGQVVYNKSSTIGESYARGMADMVRSAGQANLSNSEAAINYEAARSANFENRIQYTETYFEMKRMNKQYRAAYTRPPPTQEQLFRYAKERMPDRLGSSDLDPFHGTIAWPIVLRQEEYVVNRESLEALFADRAVSQGGDLDQYMKIRSTVDEMHALMKMNLKKYPPSAYMEAKKFLVSLKYEAKMPVQ